MSRLVAASVDFFSDAEASILDFIATLVGTGVLVTVLVWAWPSLKKRWESRMEEARTASGPKD